MIKRSAVRATSTAMSVFVALTVAAAGCSDKNTLTSSAPSTPPPTSVAPTPSSTPSPPLTPTPTPSKTPDAVSGPNAKFADDPAVQAFLAFRKARAEAFRRRTLNHAPYRLLATRAQLASDAKQFATMKRDDLALRGSPYYVVQKSTRLAPDQVLVRACQDDGEAYWVHRKTGKIAIPVANRWIPVEVRVVRVAGVWKVDPQVRAKFKCKGELRK